VTEKRPTSRGDVGGIRYRDKWGQGVRWKKREGPNSYQFKGGINSRRCARRSQVKKKMPVSIESKGGDGARARGPRQKKEDTLREIGTSIETALKAEELCEGSTWMKA